MDAILAPLKQIFDLGGPVVATLAAVSVVALAITLYKLWQFRTAGVGKHQKLHLALAAYDEGNLAACQKLMQGTGSYFAPIMAQALTQLPQGAPDLHARLEAEAEVRFLHLERGFRALDSIAQLSPLLGLFGTVLGMIEAFQALQGAGSAVDPSILAGGIWVALLTTAVGLAVAMPTALVLSWLESRMETERVLAETIWSTLLSPNNMRAKLALEQPQGTAAHVPAA